ncbi:MAG TPA: S1C family serine protease [Actinomycetes bacterium]
MSALEELEQAVGQVAGQVGGAVVGIGRGWGRGSGVVVADGRIVTNAHNLRGDQVTVVFADGRAATGQVQGVDVDGDLAVVAVDTAGATPVSWADEGSSLAVGAVVFALANPGGRLRITAGMVSSVDRAFRGPRGRRIAGSIEHTAPLARGSSGGPVVNRAGQLVGLNTHRLGEGFYLALPADAELRRRIDGLARGESPTRPRLGVGIAPAGVARKLRRAVGLPEREGLLVRVVEEGSPAHAAGVEAGDLIVSVDGQPVTDADQLYAALDRVTGQRLALGIVRGVDERTVTVSFGPEAPRDVGSA